MEVPKDFDALLSELNKPQPKKEYVESRLEPEDEEYFEGLIDLVRSARPAVIMVRDKDDRIKFMFLEATRAEAVSLMAEVLRVTGERIRDEQGGASA